MDAMYFFGPGHTYVSDTSTLLGDMNRNILMFFFFFFQMEIIFTLYIYIYLSNFLNWSMIIFPRVPNKSNQASNLEILIFLYTTFGKFKKKNFFREEGQAKPSQVKRPYYRRVKKGMKRRKGLITIHHMLCVLILLLSTGRKDMCIRPSIRPSIHPSIHPSLYYYTFLHTRH